MKLGADEWRYMYLKGVIRRVGFSGLRKKFSVHRLFEDKRLDVAAIALKEKLWLIVKER